MMNWFKVCRNLWRWIVLPDCGWVLGQMEAFQCLCDVMEALSSSLMNRRSCFSGLVFQFISQCKVILRHILASIDVTILFFKCSNPKCLSRNSQLAFSFFQVPLCCGGLIQVDWGRKYRMLVQSYIANAVEVVLGCINNIIYVTGCKQVELCTFIFFIGRFCTRWQRTAVDPSTVLFSLFLVFPCETWSNSLALSPAHAIEELYSDALADWFEKVFQGR
uniref:Putative secreted protein n=1 Tax=Ixodes ricinus TaxID=34613 RepID=A0A6B0V3C5_IXORI